VFAKKKGVYVSAHNMVPGTKENPHPVDNGAVQVDGMALEFNIHPAGSRQEFVHNMGSVMKQLKAMCPGYRLVADPVAEFGKAYMDEQPEEAKELGCDPDYNAWRMGRENPRPDGDADFRTGAGHIHIGLWSPDIVVKNHYHIAIELVKQLDFYLGLPSLVYDKDTRRRELYGAAGAYRIKPYGVEYRVLSNKWVSSVRLQQWVYDNTLDAIANLKMGNNLAERYGSVQQMINRSDTRAAARVVKQYKIKPAPLPLVKKRRAKRVG
jgi:hypothetical protein